MMKKKVIFTLVLIIFAILGTSFGLYFLLRQPLYRNGVGRFDMMKSNPKIAHLVEAEVPEWVDVQLIDLDGEARRGVPLEDITAIAVHYVGNPGSTAQGNRDYFNNEGTTVSSHFVIGLEGEVIQCVPLWEKSSATNERNRDTISIECCHPDEGGQFNEKTYASLVKLCAWLCDLNDLTEKDIIRHYDVTGKLCPKYYVEHEDAWRQFLSDVARD